MPVHLNSPWWQIRRSSRSGGPRRGPGADLAPFPSGFLAPGAQVVEDVILQPTAAARTRAGEAAGALDCTYGIEPGYTAVLAVRQPSGALAFSFPIETTRRGRRGGTEVRFQSAAPRAATRGLAGQAIRAIVIKIAKVAGDKAVSYLLPRLAETLEREVWTRRGLQEGWLKVSRETLSAGALEPRAPVSPLRSLLFLHGSFSNAAATFGPLADSDFLSRVKDTYADRIHAFDAFTISRTPADAARLLLESLPEHETTFDVVTHGAGGLVLRTLVESAEGFGALSRRFTLNHAVLVASPNAGTPLASSQRWDSTLGWLANVLEMLPDNPFTTGSAFVANGLAWLANHALGDLPGLRAMDPSAPSIGELQRRPGPPAAAYSALVANYQPGEAIVQRLLDMGIDQFFGGANDLVVPSESGWRIDRSRTTYIPATRIGCYGPGGNLPGDTVTHASYFSQPATVDFMVNALLGREQPLTVIDPRKALPDRRLLRGGTDAPAGVERLAGTEPVHGGSEQPVVPPLRITVVNGDLTFERDALLLGHYHATRLTGTEKVMDGLIGGTMARSLAMGVYPVAPGSHQIFINNRPNLERGTFLPRPIAVIVVGLGEEGKLRAADLALSVRQAVMAWSQRLAEERDGPPRTFDLVATLLGSGGTGVSAGEAARLIAEGVYEANAFLANEGSDLPSPRVDHLRFIELYLDRATDAWRALRLQAEARPGRYDVTDVIKEGPGGLTRHPELGYRGAEYDFITVEASKDADGTPLIAYKLDTRRARSEVRGQRAQSRLIGELVAAGSSDKNNDERIGRTLFDLVVPMEIEAYLAGSGEMQIELDPQTASIPWELLDTERDSSEDLPWAIRVKLLRKLRVSRFREGITDAGAEGGALVIGEPECPPGDFPRLYGARSEALAVRASLTEEGGLPEDAVVGLISPDATQAGPNATDVVNALFERPWRIVHIAGHGVPGKGGNPGGVVLSSGAFLGPAEIGNMRTVPDLMFVNCCHLGAADARQLLNTRFDRATFASGLAGALIERGVRCVIAAGWAVDDEGARVFAETFYGSLVRGERFIDAVSHARRETYLHDPHQNTWAAYQCYGDPDWTFRPAPPDANRAPAPSVDEFSGIASALSLKLALERIHVQIRYQGADPEKQLEKLRHLESVHAARWGGQGDVAELLGAAFTEAGDVEAGLRWYEKAVTSADGRASMQAAEQLANVRGRLGWEIVDRAARHLAESKERENLAGFSRKAAADARRARVDAERALRDEIARAERLIADSLALLEKLTAIEPTLERARLVGSAYKRLALVNMAAGRRRQADQALKRMLASYAEAQAIGERSGAPDIFYPAANGLIAEVALRAGTGRWRTLDAERVEIIKASLGARDPGFWTAIAEIDLDLYAALATRQLAAKRSALQKAYEDLHRRVHSTRMWGSVYETASLVLPAYAGRTSRKESEAALALLALLRQFAHSA